MLVEIKDIYKYQKEVPAPMLSNHTADYWAPYRNNYTYYDRIFKKKYASFFPFDQEGDVEDVAADFSDDVKAWLMMNDKRYAELFRINTIQDDEKYSLTDNVYEHEIIEKDISNSGTNIKGSETITDAAQNSYGAQTDTEDKESVYGAQTDTEDKERVYGSQLVEVDGTVSSGNGHKVTENSTSAYNDSGYSPANKTEETEDSRTETTNMDTTHGAHTDTENNSITHGSHTDTQDNSYVHGAHTDNLSNTHIEGQRTDTTSGTGSEDTERTRSGNIGVMTVDQMLNIHKNMWVDFSFYDFIFSEIARELLRGCA